MGVKKLYPFVYLSKINWLPHLPLLSGGKQQCTVHTRVSTKGHTCTHCHVPDSQTRVTRTHVHVVLPRDAHKRVQRSIRLRSLPCASVSGSGSGSGPGPGPVSKAVHVTYRAGAHVGDEIAEDLLAAVALPVRLHLL